MKQELTEAKGGRQVFEFKITEAIIAISLTSYKNLVMQLSK